jgi:hypothetical protein
MKGSDHGLFQVTNLRCNTENICYLWADLETEYKIHDVRTKHEIWVVFASFSVLVLAYL